MLVVTALINCSRFPSPKFYLNIYIHTFTYFCPVHIYSINSCFYGLSIAAGFKAKLEILQESLDQSKFLNHGDSFLIINLDYAKKADVQQAKNGKSILQECFVFYAIYLRVVNNLFKWHILQLCMSGGPSA